MEESSDKTWSTGEGNGKPLQYSCLENPMNNMKRTSFIIALLPLNNIRGLTGRFPDSSVGKESIYNVGDSGLIPGLGRSNGGGIGYPLQYSWASPVAQLVKNPPAMRETWVRSLGWEDPLEKGKATHSSILAWRIPRTV